MLWVSPDPPLRTPDLVLRAFRVEDAPSIVAACKDPDISRFTFMKEGLTEDEATEWIERGNESWSAGHLRFAIVDRVDDRLLGQIGAAVNEQHRSAEAFYWVAPGARRRGVASSALALIADWVFANGVERLWLLVHPENDASSRVAKRCGFVREGVLRAFEPFKGGRPDLVSWSLLPGDPRPIRSGDG